MYVSNSSKYFCILKPKTGTKFKVFILPIVHKTFHFKTVSLSLMCLLCRLQCTIFFVIIGLLNVGQFKSIFPGVFIICMNFLIFFLAEKFHCLSFKFNFSVDFFFAFAFTIITFIYSWLNLLNFFPKKLILFPKSASHYLII